MQTTIIIPCYNEANRLDNKAFMDFALRNADVSFLFVNDGSCDDTLLVLRRMAEQNERIHYLDVQPNGGKAEAVRKGMMYALENFPSDYLAFWDADLATPLDEIRHFMQAISTSDFDVVTGMRLARLGARIKRKRSRHYLGRCFATTASIVLKLPVYDTQCGAKMYKSTIVPVLFADPFITRWLFDVELLARYVQRYGIETAKNKILEYPLFSWEDVGGSQLKLKDFIKAPYELLKIKRKYKK